MIGITLTPLRGIPVHDLVNTHTGPEELVGVIFTEHEIAATFEEASLPGGFHQAAAEIYRRMAEFKDAPDLPDLNSVLNTLLTE